MKCLLLFHFLFLSTNFSNGSVGAGGFLVRLSCLVLNLKPFEKLLVIKIVTDTECGNRESFKYCSQTYIVKQGNFHSCHVTSVFQSPAGKLMGTSTAVAQIFA